MGQSTLYYHYTSRQAAQDILCQNLIKLNDYGLIYLTTIRYEVGHEAANALSIADKPVVIGFEIPLDRVEAPSDPTPVNPLPDANDPTLYRRRGGGIEVTTSSPIHANQLHWFSLQEP